MGKAPQSPEPRDAADPRALHRSLAFWASARDYLRCEGSTGPRGDSGIVARPARLVPTPPPPRALVPLLVPGVTGREGNKLAWGAAERFFSTSSYKGDVMQGPIAQKVLLLTLGGGRGIIISARGGEGS